MKIKNVGEDRKRDPWSNRLVARSKEGQKISGRKMVADLEGG